MSAASRADVHILPAQGDGLERAYQRLLELAVHVAEDVVGVRARQRRLVGARFDQCREDVRDGHDAHEVADALRTELVRIAAAVEILMVMPYGVEDLGRN